MTDDMAEKVVNKHLVALVKTLKEKGVLVEYDNDVVSFLRKKGITKEYGARELLRVIDSELKMLFVNYLLDGKSGSVIVKVDNDQLNAY